MPAVHSRHTRDDDDDDDDFEAELCHRRMRRVHAATAARRRQIMAVLAAADGQGPEGKKRREKVFFCWSDHVERMTAAQFKLRYRLDFGCPHREALARELRLCHCLHGWRWHTIRPCTSLICSSWDRCRGSIGCLPRRRSAAERVEALCGGLAERIEALCGRQDHAVGHKLLLAVHRFRFS